MELMRMSRCCSRVSMSPRRPGCGRALAGLLLGVPAHAGLAALTAEDLRRRIAYSPTVTETGMGQVTERHETAWALADFFDAARLPALAEVPLARDPRPDRRVRGVGRALRHEPPPGSGAWVEAERRCGSSRSRLCVKLRCRRAGKLAVTPARSLLDAVGRGVTLTEAGYLPPTMAVALDNEFGWSDEHPPRPPRGETDLPMLLFLDQHLREQGLLAVRAGGAGRPARGAAPRRPGQALGRRGRSAPSVAPGLRAGRARGARETLLRAAELTRDQLRDEMTFLLSGKWQGTEGRTVEEGVRGVELTWYRVGVTLGWWDREGGLWSAKVRLGAFGRAAAASAFWAVVSAQ